jgi:hypothetical protein
LSTLEFFDLTPGDAGGLAVDAAIQRDEAIRFGEWQRADQGRVYQGEDDEVGGYADGQGEYDDESSGAHFQEGAEGELQGRHRVGLRSDCLR